MKYGNVNINPKYRDYVWDHVKLFFDKYQKIYGNKEPVFVCVGTPLVPGDAVGPYVGTELKKLGYNVYGTEEKPVHAENIKSIGRRIWVKDFLNFPIIAIDASISYAPTGYIDWGFETGLAAGKGVGKDLGIIGNSHIKVTTATDQKGLFTISNDKVSALAECLICAIHTEISNRNIGNADIRNRRKCI